MCLAVVLPPQGNISRHHLRRAWDKNPHGCGFAYVGNEGLVAERYLHGFKRFYRQLCSARAANPNSNFLVHFRKASIGSVSIENCHPFILGPQGDIAVVHNGTLSQYKSMDSGESDTARFCREVLSSLPPRWWESSPLKMLVEMFLEKSRVAILTRENEVIILNQGEWIFDKDIGCTLSNLCYLPDAGKKEEKESGIWVRIYDGEPATKSLPLFSDGERKHDRCDVCGCVIVGQASYTSCFDYAAEAIARREAGEEKARGKRSTIVRCCRKCLELGQQDRSDVICGYKAICGTVSCVHCLGGRTYWILAYGVPGGGKEVDARCPRCHRPAAGDTRLLEGGDVASIFAKLNTKTPASGVVGGGSTPLLLLPASSEANHGIEENIPGKEEITPEEAVRQFFEDNAIEVDGVISEVVECNCGLCGEDCWPHDWETYKNYEVCSRCFTNLYARSGETIVINREPVH
jgi:hypothetical protein